MKKIKFYIVLFIISGCVSVNLIQEPQTEQDKEKVKGLSSDDLKNEDRKVFVLGRASGKFEVYSDAVNTSSVEMAESIGGVKVLELRDLAVKNKELKIADRAGFKTLALNQLLGTDDGIFNTAKSLDADLILKTELVNVQVSERSAVENLNSSRGILNPSQLLNVYADQMRMVSGNLWTIDIQGEVAFKILDARSKTVLFEGRTEGKYAKGYMVKPPANEASLLLPIIIEQCFEDMRPEIQKLVPLKSFILALKGEKKYAMIYAGNQNRITNGRMFDIMDGDNRAATVKIFQVNQTDSWGKVSGDLSKVKIGSKVVLKPQELSIFYRLYRYIESSI